MHKGYYGISGNRLSLRGVLEPADGSHRSRWCGDRQLEVNAPYLSQSGDLCRVMGDGMLVECASAVDAVTFAVGTRAARCPGFREADSSCDGSFFILETTAIARGAFSAFFPNAP